MTAGLVAALIICCCLAISPSERTFDCLRDALQIPHGEIVAVEEHSCHTTRLKAKARTATGAERERLWEKALKFWPPYADYAKKTERQIPVVLLEPAG